MQPIADHQDSPTRDPLRIIQAEMEILDKKILAYEDSCGLKKEALRSKIASLWERHLNKTKKICEILGFPEPDLRKTDDVEMIRLFLVEEKKRYSGIEWSLVPKEKKGLVQITQIIFI
jgi:hypothetical protein